jgi:hypothetical protein
MSNTFLATNRQLWKLNQLGLLVLLVPGAPAQQISKDQAEQVLKTALASDIEGHST